MPAIIKKRFDVLHWEELYKELTIPLYQQMIIMGCFILEAQLNIEGTFVLEV